MRWMAARVTRTTPRREGGHAESPQLASAVRRIELDPLASRLWSHRGRILRGARRMTRGSSGRDIYLAGIQNSLAGLAQLTDHRSLYSRVKVIKPYGRVKTKPRGRERLARPYNASIGNTHPRSHTQHAWDPCPRFSATSGLPRAPPSPTRGRPPGPHDRPTRVPPAPRRADAHGRIHDTTAAVYPTRSDIRIVFLCKHTRK